MGQHTSQPVSIGEQQRLLPPDPEHSNEMDHDGCFPPHRVDDICPANPWVDLPVYVTIHRIRKDIIEAIDDPYSLEQLRDPRMNLSVVRPLVDKFYEMDDVSIIYCLLVNKAQFLREVITMPHQQSVCTTRALLCELIANRVLRRVHEDNQGAKGLLRLSQILVGGFDPFQGAPDEVIQEHSNLAWTLHTRTGYKRKLPALEIAIISESKTFLSSSACQRVVNAIYEGRVVYTPTSFVDILPDHYKQKPISLYDPRKGPLLNQYRLIVPRTRNILEICQFVLLLVLFLWIMEERDPSTFSVREIVFMIYTLGWVLDLIASILEHGWHVYTQNLWSFLDVTFSFIFAIYLALRLHGWRTGQQGPGQQAMDVLAMGAPLLVPRLAFNLMSENMLFISLREMMKDFTVLTILAVWCFAGFLLSMSWLSNGSHEVVTISKWMLWIWFGLDGTGIQRSTEFHPLLGPVLMVAFAFLGNTLFLTILVSMLSTTFSTIVANATAEIQFRRAVLTLEGVKSDAIFAYQPPFNILALLTLLPLKTIISPRWFHKINVAAVRTLNAPLLLLIGLIERRTLWAGSRRSKEEDLPKLTKTTSRAGLWDFRRGFSVHGDISAVFDAVPPQEIRDEIEADDDFTAPSLHAVVSRELQQQQRRRRSSTLGHRPSVSINADAGTPQKGKAKSVRRKDSLFPFDAPSSSSSSSSSSDDEDVDEFKARMEALEKSNARMERMLLRLCADLDPPFGREDGGLEEEGEGEGEGEGGYARAGTMRDLDTSGGQDVDV